MLKEIFLDFVFPRKCAFCDSRIIKDYTCKRCEKKLEYMYAYEVIFTSKNANEIYYDKCFCAYLYEDIIRQKLLELKFKNKKYLYGALSERLTSLLQEQKNNIDLVLSVPISFKRYCERGYNQSELLAKQIAMKLEIPYEKFVLIKKKDNAKQSTLSLTKRKSNVYGVYTVWQAEKIVGKNILLIDDIFTTGSTVNECCRVLKASGANVVIVGVVAKAEIHNMNDSRQ